MKPRIIVATILFISVLATNVLAEISIKAEVDKTTMSTDEELIYKLIITSSETEIPQPQIPKFEGFSVMSEAQSTTFSYLKGGPRTILVYAFVLAPTNIGKFQIEPSAIKIKDKTYSTDTFEIEVNQGKTKPKGPPEKKSPLPEGLPPEPEQPQYTL